MANNGDHYITVDGGQFSTKPADDPIDNDYNRTIAALRAGVPLREVVERMERAALAGDKPIRFDGGFAAPITPAFTRADVDEIIAEYRRAAGLDPPETDDQTDAHRYMMEGLRLGQRAGMTHPLAGFARYAFDRYKWEPALDERPRFCFDDWPMVRPVLLDLTGLLGRCVIEPIEPATNTPPNRETDPCD